MVCSSCGQERPDGDRFCGRCGTPLPHRLLSVEGTLSLARGRWENSSSHRTSTAGAGVLELPRANTTPRASEEAVSDVSSRDSDDSQITSDAQPADLVEQASSIETPDEAPSLPTEFASTPEVQEAPPSEPLDSSAQAPISPPEETATIVKLRRDSLTYRSTLTHWQPLLPSLPRPTSPHTFRGWTTCWSRLTWSQPRLPRHLRRATNVRDSWIS